MRHWDANRPDFGRASLTDTERRIADLVAQDLSHREVAGQLFLSAHTVTFHLRHIFWKLDTRHQLARTASLDGRRASVVRVTYINSAGGVVANSTLPAATQELVKLRASQINGCGMCTDMHSKDALHAGESQVRLNLVAA